MESVNRKVSFTDIILFFIFLTLIALPAYLCYQIFIVKDIPENQQIETIEEKQSPEEQAVEEEIPQGPHYQEMIRDISGQIAYIAVPTNIDETDPPGIVIYNHGSTTTVSSDLKDLFMLDLQAYAKKFTLNNLIFCASNFPLDDNGDPVSIENIQKMVEYIQQNYSTSKEILLIAFSKGAIGTVYYALEYPENISRIALLAPTTRIDEWDENKIAKIKDIDIKIWHGNKDVNIGIYKSESFVKYMKDNGKDIPLIELDGKTHFDLDTEYMNDVLNFFLD